MAIVCVVAKINPPHFWGVCNVYACTVICACSCDDHLPNKINYGECVVYVRRDFSRKSCQRGHIGTFDTLGGAIVDIWNMKPRRICV